MRIPKTDTRTNDAGEHAEGLKQNRSANERYGRKGYQGPEYATDGWLGDGSPEGHASHEEPGQQGRADGADDGEAERPEIVLNSTARHRRLGNARGEE